MAVRKVGTLNRYVGLSDDVKPTGVPIGSTFLARDPASGVHTMYITHDGNNWVEKKEEDVVPELLAEVISELRAIRRGHELHLWGEEVTIED